MLLFYLNAGLVLLLLVLTAAALVALAFARPPQERRLSFRRRIMLHGSHGPGVLSGGHSRRRRAA